MKRHLLGALLAGAIFATNAISQSPSHNQAASQIAPWMTPPAEFATQCATLKDLLTLEDGSPVKSKADWIRRRTEILKTWTKALGEGPKPLEKPELQTLKEEDAGSYRRVRVRLEIMPSLFQEGWLLMPKQSGKRPAVVVPFYNPETSVGLGPKANRDFAQRLAERGFVALAIGSPGGDARKPEPNIPGWQPLSFLATISANCANLLANLPEVDPARIGIVGHSYGGKWAMFSACLNERFACAAWSDPGIGFDDHRGSINYWEPWYLGRVFDGPQRQPGLPTPENPATGPYAQLRKNGHDLHELQALMAPRPFFVSGGSEDPPNRWLLLNQIRKVYQLLNAEGKVGMHNRPLHEPTEEALDLITSFFVANLKP
jgi:hypothetical protein